MAKRLEDTARRPDNARFMMLDMECEQLRVELEDVLHQVQADASRISGLEREVRRLEAVNDRLMTAASERARYRDASLHLRNQIIRADKELKAEREANRVARADLATAREALSVSNKKLAMVNEELHACMAALLRRNMELQAANDSLARQRTEFQETADVLSFVLETKGVLVAMLDASGRLNAFNHACVRMTGYAAAEVLGKSLIDILVPPEERKAMSAVHSKLVEGAAGMRHQNHWLTRTGGRRRINWSCSAIRNGQGETRRIVMTGIDVTDLHEKDRRIRKLQAEVLQLLGITTLNELGSLIMHELAQPLTAMVSYAELCRNLAQTGNPCDPTLIETIEKFVAQANRASEMITRLRHVSGKSEPNDAPFDLKRVVSDAVAFLEPEARARSVRLVSKLANDLPNLRGNCLQFEQAVINLVRNGIEAITAKDPRRRRVNIEARVSAGSVEVAVKDTGSGLPPSLRQDPFQPFFTTKRHGLGIGLSLCRTIVEHHGGNLKVIPRPGGGTVIRIFLPIPEE